MYLLTVRDGLHTRHIGPYASPPLAAADLDQLLAGCSPQAHWQIHRLESPDTAVQGPAPPGGTGALMGGGKGTPLAA
ncbi:MAG: hypothetical protein NT158_11210 [Cyanobacteria bacterium]|nr:hypothetical protein [Cyanobacteriota bacterium]